jgi:hypothetical protein
MRVRRSLGDPVKHHVTIASGSACAPPDGYPLPVPVEPSVSARFGSAAPATAVAERLVLAMAARTDLDIDAVDEFVMAVDLALATCPPGEVRLEARIVDTGLEVILGPVDPDRLANREPLLASLVDQVELRGEQVALRAGV